MFFSCKFFFSHQSLYIFFNYIIINFLKHLEIFRNVFFSSLVCGFVSLETIIEQAEKKELFKIFVYRSIFAGSFKCGFFLDGVLFLILFQEIMTRPPKLYPLFFLIFFFNCQLFDHLNMVLFWMVFCSNSVKEL